MRTRICIAFAALALGGAVQAAEPPPSVARLIAQLEPLNDTCRGGSGDNPATMKACEQRDRKFAQIVKAGWCLGPDDAPSSQKVWMQCATRTRTPATTSEAVCSMFKGPTAVVCHDQATAASAFERYRFDAVALAAPAARAYLQKFGCTPVDTQSANQISWVSDTANDQRTARAGGPITVGFVKKASTGPNVAAWAVATDYLNRVCRTPSLPR